MFSTLFLGNCRQLVCPNTIGGAPNCVKPCLDEKEALFKLGSFSAGWQLHVLISSFRRPQHWITDKRSPIASPCFFLSQSFCGMTTACSHFILFSISWQSTFGVHTLMNRVHALFVFHFVFHTFDVHHIFCIHTHGIQCMLFDSVHSSHFCYSPKPLKKN